MITFFEGTTYRRRFQLTDDADPANNIDLTGHTFLEVHYHVRGVDTPTFTLSVANGNLTVVDATGGLIEIEFAPSASVGFVGNYVGWVSLIDAAGDEWEARLPSLHIEEGDPNT